MSGLLMLLLGLLACAPLLLVCVAQSSPPVFVLTEMCHYTLNIDYIEHQLGNFSMRILPAEETCGDRQKLLHALSTCEGPLVGSLEAEVCSPARFMAKFYNKTLLTWTCPQVDIENGGMTLAPTLMYTAQAFVRMFSHIKWKSAAIVSSDTGWWPSLSQSLDLHLRQQGVIPKHLFVVGKRATRQQVREQLRILKKNTCRVVVVCAAPDPTGLKILRAMEELHLAADHSTLIILMDIATVPAWRRISISHETQNTTSELNITNLIADTISSVTKQYLLLFSDSDSTSDCETDLARNINRSFALLTDESVDAIEFFLLDLTDGDNWRQLVRLSNDGDAVIVEVLLGNMDEWSAQHANKDECEGCDSEYAKILNILVIFGYSCFFGCVLIAIVAVARKQLLKKRVAKGPYKVLLTATDFVFPQIPDSRRVDEGIEAMLCCWLQQLQEFGGPEVEKPDLLQGSGGSMRTPLRTSSSPNLAKQLIVDPRVRYNGDLVQMKPLPAGSNSVELKAKAVEVLVLLHGLRHENLNPLIGCLAEPPRAALVSEWCARGSLQDVLQQDDIKLDWSFRLSLLTDLVRGMKYLHSSPIRVHGYLTSRNCVIDARWVLKITDYGLPAFYEAQSITPPTKIARDLLWTSPELLRHPSLRKRGTQPGDVYSFGIILQEVVVRGEPFCMLALTPEEIIEKVKAPPPLIRPSVSKGAAPPEAINIMRQCWAEQAEMRPDFNAVHDLFKKLNHGKKVNIVDTMFQMLEKYSNNLEELIRERTEQLDFEKKKTEQLLNRMLPSPVAEKLKLGMPVDPEEFEEVTIYFSDIVGFTTISAYSTPFQVVDLLNDLYTCFDATINAYNVYKVETIGDAYMVVGGLPVRVPDHAEQIATMALDLLHQSGRFRIRHLPGTPLRLRIGLHTGPCCAGVVGLTMPRYCLFGDTVNTASRMESTGAAWRIHLSEATKERLERAGGYQLEYRGPTEVKGKGTMHTYWLLGKAGFDKPLPVPPPIEESHGLDESLIICNTANNFKQIRDATTSADTTETRNSLEDYHTEAPLPRSPNPSITNPSFIKSMEQSKFSALVKNQEDHKHEYHMVKSTSSDTPMSLGTPVSASEVAAALLGASTNSLCGYRNRHRKIEEEDISTPYNHYKCLSPKQRVGKLLRRQFSLDRTEESRTEESSPHHETPRLYKQNSAGAADLEKIEEMPFKSSTPSGSTGTSVHCTLSISVDSLIH